MVPPSGQEEDLGAVVGRPHDDRVVDDAKLLEEVEQHAHHLVELDHAVGIDPEPGDAPGLGLQVREDVHAGRIEPDEEGATLRVRLADERHGLRQHLFVDRLHALPGQRSGVGDPLRAVGVREGVDDATRSVVALEVRVVGIVLVLRLLLGVQVVEVPEELVESVGGRQVLVAVAEVVLAELPAAIAERLEQRGDRGVLRLHAEVGTGQADLGEPGADGALAGDERGTSGGAALLPVPVGEERAFAGQPIDVRRAIAHEAQVEAAGVAPADVVAPDDEDVRRLGRDDRRRDEEQHEQRWHQRSRHQRS